MSLCVSVIMYMCICLCNLPDMIYTLLKKVYTLSESHAQGQVKLFKAPCIWLIKGYWGFWSTYILNTHQETKCILSFGAGCIKSNLFNQMSESVRKIWKKTHCQQNPHMNQIQSHEKWTQLKSDTLLAGYLPTSLNAEAPIGFAGNTLVLVLWYLHMQTYQQSMRGPPFM